MLNIIKTVENGKAVFTLEGRLDTTTASALEKELAESLEGVSELCFDFAGLDYISSAGLRVLLATQKTMNRQGEMKIVHAGEIVREVFDVTGFSDILTIV